MGEVIAGGVLLGVLLYLEERSRNSWFYPFLMMGVTLLHELSHFAVALLLGGKPSLPSIVPKREGDGWVLGQVTFHPTPLNAFPSALAPLLILPVALFLIKDLPLGLRELGLFFALKAFLPSSQDLRVAFSYPVASALWIVGVVTMLNLAGKILLPFVKDYAEYFLSFVNL